jgi:ERCC4-type nuclease
VFVLDTNQANTSRKVGDDLIPLLEERETVKIEHLDSGDIAVRGGELSIGIELKKSPSDVLASLRDGRLMTQPPRMLEEYDLSYIVTIGEPVKVNTETGKLRERRRQRSGELKFRDTKFSYHYLNSLLTKFEMAGGRFRHVKDTEHLAALLLSLHHYWQKEKHSKETFHRVRHSFVDWRQLDNPLAEVFERIPVGKNKKGQTLHLGIKRAVSLVQYCDSLRELADVTFMELAAIPGFGRKTAKAVVEFVESGKA